MGSQHDTDTSFFPYNVRWHHNTFCKFYEAYQRFFYLRLQKWCGASISPLWPFRGYFIVHFYFYDLNLAVFVVSGIKYFPTALSDDTIRSNVRSAADIFWAEGS